MVTKKNYKSFTGLTEFHYGVLNADETGIVETSPERIEFAQEISVDTPQEITRASGDNKTAELAVANGPISVVTSFHKVPMEDKIKILGLKKVGSGVAYTPNMTPPHVACAFARTAEDGGTEWLGFAKGLFTMSSISGKSKEDGSIEFSKDEVNGEFMPRKVDGIEDEDEGTMFVFYDAKGSTTNRDFLFNLIFGKPHPDATPEV